MARGDGSIRKREYIRDGRARAYLIATIDLG